MDSLQVMNELPIIDESLEIIIESSSNNRKNIDEMDHK